MHGMEHSMHGIEHPMHGMEHPMHGIAHPMQGMEHPIRYPDMPQSRRSRFHTADRGFRYRTCGRRGGLRTRPITPEDDVGARHDLCGSILRSPR